MSRTFIQAFAATVAVASLLAACSDEPTGLKTGILEVIVRSSGDDVDIDGFDIVVDSATRQFTFGTLPTDVRNLSAGSHTVRLESVAGNCAIQGSPSRSVMVTPGKAATVTFDIKCVATHGTISVQAHATGVDIQNVYHLTLNGRSAGDIPVNGSVILPRLDEGTDTVGLIPYGENCTVPGGDHVAAKVVAGTTTPVLFEIACTTPVRSEKIAYTIDTVINGSKQTWIGVMWPDGQRPTPLARGSSPSWSPDGTKLVFSNSTCTTDFYYYYKTCTGGLATIDPETRNVDAMDVGLAAFSPSWAPRGNLIAFVGCCIGPDPDILYVVRAGGGTPAAKLSAPNAQEFDPAWSPDGARIAFACYYPFNNAEICVMNADGTQRSRLTNDSAADSHPAWSPDGKSIAFTSDAQIAVMPVEGGNVTRLTTGIQPAWSRDGTKLVFYGGDGLYTINADGSKRTRLTLGAHYAPAWRP